MSLPEVLFSTDILFFFSFWLILFGFNLVLGKEAGVLNRYILQIDSKSYLTSFFSVPMYQNSCMYVFSVFKDFSSVWDFQSFSLVDKFFRLVFLFFFFREVLIIVYISWRHIISISLMKCFLPLWLVLVLSIAPHSISWTSPLVYAPLWSSFRVFYFLVIS